MSLCPEDVKASREPVQAPQGPRVMISPLNGAFLGVWRGHVTPIDRSGRFLHGVPGKPGA